MEPTCQISSTWTREYLLKNAQTAYFLAIIITRWAAITVCRTRRISLLRQGFTNWGLVASLVFMTTVAACLIYIEVLNTPFGSAPVSYFYWCFPVPGAMIIVFLDEARKWCIRQSEKRGTGGPCRQFFQLVKNCTYY